MKPVVSDSKLNRLSTLSFSQKKVEMCATGIVNSF